MTPRDQCSMAGLLARSRSGTQMASQHSGWPSAWERDTVRPHHALRTRDGDRDRPKRPRDFPPSIKVNQCSLGGSTSGSIMAASFFSVGESLWAVPA